LSAIVEYLVLLELGLFQNKVSDGSFKHTGTCRTGTRMHMLAVFYDPRTPTGLFNRLQLR